MVQRIDVMIDRALDDWYQNQGVPPSAIELSDADYEALSELFLKELVTFPQETLESLRGAGAEVSPGVMVLPDREVLAQSGTVAGVQDLAWTYSHHSAKVRRNRALGRGQFLIS